MAEQLLTDTADIRVSLLELPRYSLSDEGSATAAMSYNRYVSKGVSKIETLLRMLMTPDSPPEELIEAYMRLVGDRSFSNFQKILELKGIRKVDQNAVLDSFISQTGQRDDLSDSSFLTSLGARLKFRCNLYHDC